MPDRSTPPEEGTATSEAVAAVGALGALDDAIFQKARLGIMSTLVALGEADFTFIKETLGLSDGNLSAHMTHLEERGYVIATKEFVRRKPRTTYRPTERGHGAVKNYLLAIERVIRAAERAGEAAALPAPRSMSPAGPDNARQALKGEVLP